MGDSCFPLSPLNTDNDISKNDQLIEISKILGVSDNHDLSFISRAKTLEHILNMQASPGIPLKNTSF